MGQNLSSSEKLIKQQQENTINFVSSNESSSENISQNMVDKTIQPDNQDDVNIQFKWPFGGQQIFLTGNFTQWQNHIPMNKVGNEFIVIIKLSPGIYQYKFIVDGEWRFSADDNQAPDENGNINNIIDTRNYDQTEECDQFQQVKKTPQEQPIIFNKHASDSSLNTSNTNTFHVRLQSNQSVENFQKKSNEKIKAEPNKKSQEFHKIHVFAESALPLPPHLNQVLNIIENEKYNKYLWKKETQNQNCTLEQWLKGRNQIDQPTHCILNHLGSINNQNQNYSTYSIQQRYLENKYVTIKFYTSKYNHNQKNFQQLLQTQNTSYSSISK